MKKVYFFVCMLLCSAVSWGQVTIFSENIGSPSATTLVNSYTGWQNSSPITFASTSTPQCDVRTSGASTGYTGASGSGNVFITNTSGINLIISGINTTGYSNLALTLGHFKSTTTGNNELTIEVSSDGTTYSPLSYTRTTGSGTANWVLISPTGTIPEASNLRIRFTQTSTTTQFRIDDIILKGIPSNPTTTSINPSSATAGDPGFSLTVNGTNFISGSSTVRWNGSNRTTVFVNNTQLTATINAADIASAGSATVDVITTGAAATSNTQTFTINAGSTPAITLNPTSLSGFSYVAGSGPSGTQSFSVSGVNLTGAPGNIAVTAPTDYEINDGNGWTSSFNIPYASATLNSFNVDVRLKAGLAVGTYNDETISVSGGGDSKNETVSGSVTLGTPVAKASTVFTASSLTGDWSPGVAGATGYFLDASAYPTFTTSGTISSDGFENSLGIFTETSGTGTFSSGSSAAGDRPALSPFAAAGTYSYGIANGSVTITSSDINTSASSAAEVSFRLASFSIGSTGNGADAGDIVTVELSPDGGTTYYNTLRVLGNSNAYWDYTATGVASTAYDGNSTPVDFQPASGGLRTTDGYSTVTITGLPSVSNLKIRITLLNNNAAELWLVDDLNITGNVPSFIPGYNNLSVAGTSQAITVPGPGTYYYRVRATTGSVTSPNSNVITTVMNDQNSAKFRTAASGDYSNAGSWNFNVSGAFYVAATQAPAATNDVTVMDGHTITLTAAAAAKDLLLNPSGNIVLGNNDLVANNADGGSATGYIKTNGTGVVMVNNITSEKRVPVGNAKFNPVIIENSSGHNWSVKVTDGVTADPGLNTNKAVLVTWDITPSVNPPNAPADITFQFDETSQVGPSFTAAENVQAWHFTSHWNPEGAPTAAFDLPATRMVKVTGLTHFSPYALANVSGPLPVLINYLNGIKQGSNHNLSWQVTCTNTAGVNMVIEHSTDGRSYTSIYSVDATALQCQQPFALSVPQAAPGMNYYRLRVTDVNGKVTLSNIVALLNKQSGFDIISLSPNPVRADGKAVLNVTAAQAGTLQVVVTDMNGKKLKTQTETLVAGSKQVTMNLAGLATGTYFVTAYYSDGTSKTMRMVKQ